LYPAYGTSHELKRWLAQRGCTFEPGRGGHLTVRRSGQVTTLPMHGNKRDLPTGLVNGIKKALGLK
jgi:mRNA interferase HicA